MQLPVRVLPGLTRWGVAHLRNSRAAPYERNTGSNFRLARYSLEVMPAVRRDTHIEYGAASRGTLRIFRDEGALDRATEAAGRRSGEGLTFRRLSSNETV